MEKRSPHYALAAIQAAVAGRGLLAFTKTAREGAREMGLSGAEALTAVVALTPSAFYKAMTTQADHRVWQDVYHAPTPAGPAYVKFTLREDGSIVISFKRL